MHERRRGVFGAWLFVAAVTAVLVLALDRPDAEGPSSGDVRTTSPSSQSGPADPTSPGGGRSLFALEFERGYSELPAYVGSDFADDLQIEQSRASWDGSSSGRYVNVRDGQRVTLRPADCACPTATIWIIGGSAVWGTGQRDNHTIASELVRAAREDGISLTVENFGLQGQTMATEAARLEELLDTRPPPDMIVAMNGWNDVLATTSAFFVRGRSDEGTFINMDDLTVVNDRVEEFLTAEIGPAAGQAVAERYAILQDRVIGRADELGVATSFFFQPDALTSEEQLRPYEPITNITTTELQASPFASALETAADELGDRVIDLRGLFADYPGPVFLGLVHTNEEGARVTAEAIYDEIGPTLASRSG